MLPAAGRPTRVCRPAPLFRPACTRHATRHAPRATRHAPRTLPPNFLWAAPATTQRQEHGRASRQEQRQEHRKHRAKSDTHPKASRQEHGRRSHEDNATSASRPGRARSSPALLRQQAPSAAGNRQQAPSTAGSIDSRLHRQQAPSASGRPARRRHVQVSPSVPPAAWAYVFWARRWLRLVAAPGSCACGSDRARVCVYARFAAQWCSVQRCNACDCPRCMNSRCLEVPALPQRVKLALSASARAA